MKRFFKKHLGTIIFIVILLVFPTSLSFQARLNMRIIVTGIAVDKSEEGYTVTAQIVKNTPGTESPATSATIDFITETDKTLASAVSRLSYKAGKVAAFSHTNFVILGKTLLDEDVTKCLDYFIRDKIIKNSALLLFAEDSAKDEIKKTKNIELSVGLGLQKVFLFKERDGDGIMATVLDFLNQNKTFSKTATASVFSLMSSQEQEQKESGSGGKSGGSSGEEASSGGGSTGSGGESSGSGGGGGGSAGSTDSGSGSSGGGETETQFFTPRTPIMCFSNGMFKGKIEEDDEILGLMIARKKTISYDFYVTIKEGTLKDTKIAIAVKSKNTCKKIRFENGKPRLDISITINNAIINEILTTKIVPELTNEEFDIVVKAIQDEVASSIAACFEKSKELKIDIFNAYERALKFKYNELMEHYSSVEDFIDDLQVNVTDVKVNRLDY